MVIDNLWHNLHMFLDSLELRIENKQTKMFRKKLYILVVTQFVTQCTHVSRYPRVSNGKQKKCFGKNWYKSVVLDLWNNGIFVHKTKLKKVQKN